MEGRNVTTRYTHEQYVVGAISKRPAVEGGRSVVWDVDKGWVASTRRTEEDDIIGDSKIVLYNPTRRPLHTEMTVYFLDRPPHTFAPLEVPPERNQLLVMPDMAPEVFDDCGF